jgi:hypothetical protein
VISCPHGRNYKAALVAALFLMQPERSR